jgi:hypothetical protein
MLLALPALLALRVLMLLMRQSHHQQSLVGYAIPMKQMLQQNVRGLWRSSAT